MSEVAVRAEVASGGAIVAPLTSSAVLEPGGAAGRYRLSGALVFATARTTHAAGCRALSGSASDVGVDCSGLTRADSAGVAVLLDWLAEAKRNARHLRYEGLPDSVRAIARISEVDDLLESGV